MTRVVYGVSADGVLQAYARLFTFGVDGRLVSISAETAYTIDTATYIAIYGT